MTGRTALLCAGLFGVLAVLPAGGVAAQAPAATAPTPATPARVPAPEPEPDRLAAAKELVAMIFPDDRRDQMVGQVVQAVNGALLNVIARSPFMQQGGAQNEEVQAVVKEFIEQRQTASAALAKSEMPGMVEAVARAYARRFTVPQMEEIKQFFQTPTGKIYGEQSQTIMSDPDVVEWQQNMMRRSMADAQRDAPALAAKLRAIDEKAKASSKPKTR